MYDKGGAYTSGAEAGVAAGAGAGAGVGAGAGAGGPWACSTLSGPLFSCRLLSQQTHAHPHIKIALHFESNQNIAFLESHYDLRIVLVADSDHGIR